MKVTGVIAEYNPFHNGHQYQLKMLREQTDADYMIAAMSGNFLQRGEPALMDKYLRAQMALSCGADLVLEIPAVWACASAEYFASAGVFLLGSAGVTNTIGYGVETNQPDLLSSLAERLNHAPEAYHAKLLAAQKKGDSFPAARAAALGSLFPSVSREELTAFLSTPNNILALEYEKALFQWNSTASSSMHSYPVTRIGDHYHDTSIRSSYASATAIRRLILETDHPASSLAGLVPKEGLPVLLDAIQKKLCIPEDFISSMLYYRLLSLAETGYEDFADCSHELSCKIRNHLTEYLSFSQFCRLLKSKELTYTRISRVLIHILLGITRQDYAHALSLSRVPYLRVLGFRKSAAPLLSAIKKEASVPLITKVADASKILSQDAYKLFEIDLYASHLYRGMTAVHSGQPQKNEYTQELIIL